jgi:coenzyme Q-binding protein COQ10
MPAHSQHHHSPYTPPQLFDLVADVEQYPKFLPWCRAARVIERKENEFLGELVISFANLTESYVSRVKLKPYESIDVEMVSGPFEYLINRWHFTPEGEGTKIDFLVDFKFRSRILEKMIGPLFAKATAKMIDAFNQRADSLYKKL